MPDDVRRAKRIRHKMSDRADLGAGDGATADDFLPEETADIGTELNISDDEDVGDYQNPSDSGTPREIGPQVFHETAGAEASGLPSTESEEVPPRPLVNRRAAVRHKKDEPDDLMSLLKAQIIQDGMRRDEEHQRREQERKDREDERREERSSRQDESRRHENLMQMIMMMVCKGNGTDSFPSSS